MNVSIETNCLSGRRGSAVDNVWTWTAASILLWVPSQLTCHADFGLTRIHKSVSHFLKINLAEASWLIYTFALCVSTHTHIYKNTRTKIHTHTHTHTHTHAYTYKHTHAIGLFLWRTPTNTEWWQAHTKRSSQLERSLTGQIWWI